MLNIASPFLALLHGIGTVTAGQYRVGLTQMGLTVVPLGLLATTGFQGPAIAWVPAIVVWLAIWAWAIVTGVQVMRETQEPPDA